MTGLLQRGLGIGLVRLPRRAGLFLPQAGGALARIFRFHGQTGDRARPISVEFILPDGAVRAVVAYEGQTLLDVAAEHELPVEGACAGSCACSTCHVYLEDEDAMETFPEATDEENDMLDLAFFPQPNSRLGCQLRLVQAKHQGLRVRLPKATRNLYVDGARVAPH
ncbi:unnamed protein product [Phytomonas sp. Hart1]|nr:unnamed protein product [Phytomonas sp. Hart1]|eukprot:CCW70164.1 unnamed protein product [Phytomonas sp. isolate Hart1]